MALHDLISQTNSFHCITYVLYVRPLCEIITLWPLTQFSLKLVSGWANLDKPRLMKPQWSPPTNPGEPGTVWLWTHITSNCSQSDLKLNWPVLKDCAQSYTFTSLLHCTQPRQAELADLGCSYPGRAGVAFPWRKHGQNISTISVWQCVVVLLAGGQCECRCCVSCVSLQVEDIVSGSNVN